MVEKLLNETISEQVRQAFGSLKEPVEVLYFGSKEECMFCEETLKLLEEISDLSEKIKVTTYDIQEHGEAAKMYHVDKTPGLVILGRHENDIVDYGIRFAGIPSGHEFSSLIESLLLVSGGDSGLNPSSREYLKSVEKPVHLKVFVTPTCPYCPQAVVLAHRMALESPLVEAEMVEAVEFPELSQSFGVSGVPHTVINDGNGAMIGAAPEAQLIAEIQHSLHKNN